MRLAHLAGLIAVCVLMAPLSASAQSFLPPGQAGHSAVRAPSATFLPAQSGLAPRPTPPPATMRRVVPRAALVPGSQVSGPADCSMPVVKGAPVDPKMARPADGLVHFSARTFDVAGCPATK